MIEVKLVADWCSPAVLKAALAPELEIGSGVQLKVRRSKHQFRSSVGIDSTVLVAVVGGTSAAMAALINGVFRLLEKRRGDEGRVTIRGADGTTVEAPATKTKQELEELVELASRLQKPVIRLIRDGPDSTIR
jgi:hypothetical protein